MSTLPENALTVAEQRLNAGRHAIYNVALGVALVVGCVTSFAVWGSMWFERGIAAGVAMEKRKAEAPKAPLCSCSQLAQRCVNEQAERWKRK